MQNHSKHLNIANLNPLAFKWTQNIQKMYESQSTPKDSKMMQNHSKYLNIANLIPLAFNWTQNTQRMYESQSTPKHSTLMKIYKIKKQI